MEDSALHIAAELLGFANLELTAKNARTLWPHLYVQERWDDTLKKALEAERRRLLPNGAVETNDPLQLFLAAPPLNATADGRVQAADLSRYPAVGFPVERSPATVVRVHQEARARLTQIARAKPRAIIAVARKLQRKRLPIHLAIGLQMGDGRIRFDAPPDQHERLTDYLDGLFLQTLLAGLWPRFARCSARRCRRFVLPKRTGRDRAFCSTACRVRTHRDEQRQEIAVLRQRVQARYNELRDRLSPDEVNARLKKEFRLRSRELWHLLG